MVGVSRARVVGVEVCGCVEGLGGFERAGVDGFEGEEGTGFYCWLWEVSGFSFEMGRGITRCSSCTKMPLPMIATPMDIVVLG